MKTLQQYIGEKLVINKDLEKLPDSKEMDIIYNDFNFFGDEVPSEIVKTIKNVSFENPDKNELVILKYDAENKKLTFGNLDKIYGTIKKIDALFSVLKKYDVFFDCNELSIEIRSGGSMQNRNHWPSIDLWHEEIYDMFDCMTKNNPNIKFKLLFYRFWCYGGINTGGIDCLYDLFEKYYFDEISFEQCRDEKHIYLPSSSRLGAKNPNMKIKSDAKRRQQYYTELGY